MIVAWTGREVRDSVFEVAAFEFRAPVDSDATRLAELSAVKVAESGVHEDLETAAHVRARWEMPGFDRAKHEVLLDLDGKLAASMYLRFDQGMADGWAYVRPEFRGRGIGTALMDWLVKTARAHGEVRELYAYGTTGMPGSTELVSRYPGAKRANNFLRLRHVSPGTAAKPEWPEGVRLVPMAVEALVDVVAQIHDEAFRTNWGFRPAQRDRLLHEAKHDDPSMWLVARDADGPVGFFQSRVRQTPGLTYGEGYGIGVVDRYRGSTLPSALLREGLHRMAERGAQEVVSGVDGRLWSAVFLYTSNGYVCTHEGCAYAIPF